MSCSERRMETRKAISLSATVRSKEGSYKTSCMIQEASNMGCQIVTLSAVEIPDIISIDIEGLTGPREGQVIWRTKYRAGVKFTD